MPIRYVHRRSVISVVFKICGYPVPFGKLKHNRTIQYFGSVLEGVRLLYSASQKQDT